MHTVLGETARVLGEADRLEPVVDFLSLPVDLRVTYFLDIHGQIGDVIETAPAERCVGVLIVAEVGLGGSSRRRGAPAVLVHPEALVLQSVQNARPDVRRSLGAPFHGE